MSLTPEQIEYILDFIKPNKSLPEKTATSIVNKQKKGLRKQLETVVCHPDDVDELKQDIIKHYHSSLITPGESVGIITAQSFGEANTQNTLNTFHKAGDTDKTVVVGVARFEELLNVTKSPKGKCCSVYFTDNNNNVQELRKSIGSTIVELTVDKISTDIIEVMNKEYEDWYDIFKVLYNDDFTKHSHCIMLHVDMSILYEYSLTLQEVAETIHNNYDDLYCVFSPDSIGRIDIFVDINGIDIDEEVVYINDDNKEFVYMQEIVKPTIKKMHICGISGIKQIYYLRDKSRPGEWMVETDGSNFSEIMGHPRIDKSRTVSNDPLDMYVTLGIEAANETIYNEFLILMPKINKCHAKLLSNKMTYFGSVTSINRYGQRKDNSGPMSKASFEETLENFLNAASYGMCETTRGISSSIICGKRGKMGTGLCSLHIDINALKNCFKIEPVKIEPVKIEPDAEESIKDAVSSIMKKSKKVKSKDKKVKSKDKKVKSKDKKVKSKDKTNKEV